MKNFLEGFRRKAGQIDDKVANTMNKAADRVFSKHPLKVVTAMSMAVAAQDNGVQDAVAKALTNPTGPANEQITIQKPPLEVPLAEAPSTKTQ